MADRIDPDQLWRTSPLDREHLTQEQRDRLDAGVHLRRYASKRSTVLSELKKGAEYIRGFKLEREGFGTDRRGCGSHEWHVALNAYSDAERQAGRDGSPHWLYTAKMLADEVPRMIMLFESDREGTLPTSFKMCGHDPAPATPIADNHLRCALGQDCRACPYLAAIDASAAMTPEAKNEAKAWTCATHILLESPPDRYFEALLHEKSDALFEQRMLTAFGGEWDIAP